MVIGVFVYELVIVPWFARRGQPITTLRRIGERPAALLLAAAAGLRAGWPAAQLAPPLPLSATPSNLLSIIAARCRPVSCPTPHPAIIAPPPRGAGAGYVSAMLAMVAAAAVEIVRLDVVQRHGLQGVDPTADGSPEVPMSVWWQTIQVCWKSLQSQG